MRRTTIPRGRSWEATTYARARLLRQAVPLNVALEITHLCNLRCLYCDRNLRKEAELTTPRILGAITEFHELGTRILSLDGGDPLTHPDLRTIVDHIRGLGILIKINTNGILIPKLAETIRHVDRLKVSLDGDEANHDRMRGKGSFRQAMRGIQTALDLGVPVELTCVLHRHNLDSIFEVLAIAESLKTPVVFQPARTSLVGVGHRDSRAWMPEDAKLHRAFRMLLTARGEEKYLGNRPGSLRHFQKFPSDVELPCAAGWVNCTVDPEGRLYHCGQIPRDAYHNSILDGGVEAAWQRLERWGCGQCWCARVVEENLAWGLRFRRLLL